MSAEELDEAADRFLRGQMDPEESARFLDGLNTDPERKEYLRLNQALYEALRNSPSPFRQTMEAVNTSMALRLAPRRGWVLVVVTAVTLSILVFLGIYLNRKKNLSPEELYMAYMQAPASLSPDLAPARAPQGNQIPLAYLDSILIEVDQFYIEGHANQALVTLEAIPEALRTQRIDFQMALLSLLLDKPAEAIDLFNGISSYNLPEVNWYLALCWLKLEDIEKARYYLNRIEAGSRWYDKGRELEKKLSD